MGGVSLNITWMSSYLWSFLAQHLSEDFGRLKTVLAGEPRNGFELWRKIYQTNRGAGNYVDIGNIRSFMNFEKCPHENQLLAYVGQWQICRNNLRHNQLPDQVLREMFIDMLPSRVSSEIRARPEGELPTLQSCLDYINREMHRWNDKRIQHTNELELQKVLHTSSKNPVVHAFHDPGCCEDNMPKPQQAPADPQQPGLAEALALLQETRETLTAFQKRTPPRRSPGRTPGSTTGSGLPVPDPKFEGCWHCGKPNCTRRKCPEFLAIRKAHGGKLPSDYEGAYEKHLKAQKQTGVRAVLSGPGPEEHEETQQHGFWMRVGKGDAADSQPPSFVPTPTSNRHAALATDDDGDDENEVFKAVMQLTSASKIQTGPRESQKQRKKQQKPKALSAAQICALAAKIKDGSLTLPDLTLPTDSDWVAIRALVDSGSSVNVVNAKKIFPGAELTPPKKHVSYNTASGAEVKNEGSIVTDCKTEEGHKRTVHWEHADVDLPILSTGKMTDGGNFLGYHDTGGIIYHPPTREKSNMIKRGGVYWTKLFFKKSLMSSAFNGQCSNPGFARQGTA